METWGASSKERLVQEWDRMLAKGRVQELGNEWVYEWETPSAPGRQQSVVHKKVNLSMQE